MCSGGGPDRAGSGVHAGTTLLTAGAGSTTQGGGEARGAEGVPTYTVWNSPGEMCLFSPVSLFIEASISVRTHRHSFHTLGYRPVLFYWFRCLNCS